jgi:tetratricopeptide (TPR) repeat protein
VSWGEINTVFEAVVKAIPDTLKQIPPTYQLAALAVMGLLALMVLILRADILGMLSKEKREALIMFIVRYGFIGVGGICIASFTYGILSVRSEAAEIRAGINKQAATATPNSNRQFYPILPPEAIDNLSNSLVLLSRRLSPPPGILDALAQLKSGNPQPAIDILNNNILAEQKDKVERAATLRQIALLEFYSNTQASLATYQESLALDANSWEAWGQIAYLLERSGKHDDAAAAAQKAVAIGTSIRDMNALGIGYAALGYIEASAGHVDSARSFLDKARGNFLAAGSKREYALATNNLARVEFSEGNYDEATGYYKEALKIDTQIKNPRGVAADYSGLGGVSAQLGRDSNQYDEALDYFAKAGAANESVRDPHQAALALSGTCNVYLDRRGPGDLDKANDACAQALKLEQQIDNRTPQIYITGLLAKVAQANNQPEVAEAKYLEAIEIAKSINPFPEAVARRGLGSFYFDAKKFPAALDSFQRALAIDQKLNRPIYVAVDQSWIGAVYNEMQQKTEACKAWTASAEIYEENGVDDELEKVNEAKTKANCM